MPSFKTTLPNSDIEVTVHYNILVEYGEYSTEIEQVLLADGSEVPFKNWWYGTTDKATKTRTKRSMLSYFEAKVEDNFDIHEIDDFNLATAEARNDERNER